MAVTPGLRERKKERTRRLIANTAARLFGERGYENVAVLDVARAAEVAEQTVYNYFPTKQHLVLDREDELRDHLVRLVRDRAPGTGLGAAIRPAVLDDLAQLRASSPEQAQGELAALSAVSPAVRRFALEAWDRQADAMAEAIVETAPGVPSAVARVRALSLMSVFRLVIDEVGARLRGGTDPATIADQLVPVVDTVLADLDAWPLPG